MKTYTVNQLAQLAGISVRALHHYDEIGLLKPAFTGENRYRYYGEEELLRLQQILIHRELDIPLAEIGAILGHRAGLPGRVGGGSEHQRAVADAAAHHGRRLGAVHQHVTGK